MNLKLILLALLVAGTAFVTWSYVHTLQENKRLTGELNTANMTIAQLDEKLKSENKITEIENQTIRRIRNAPKSDDAPTAPVLLDTIMRLQNNGE